MKHALYYGGAALVVTGLGLAWLPLGFIFCGLALIWASLNLDQALDLETEVKEEDANEN